MLSTLSIRSLRRSVSLYKLDLRGIIRRVIFGGVSAGKIVVDAGTQEYSPLLSLAVHPGNHWQISRTFLNAVWSHSAADLSDEDVD
jgi:hypothetical protein